MAKSAKQQRDAQKKRIAKSKGRGIQGIRLPGESKGQRQKRHKEQTRKK